MSSKSYHESGPAASHAARSFFELCDVRTIDRPSPRRRAILTRLTSRPVVTSTSSADITTRSGLLSASHVGRAIGLPSAVSAGVDHDAPGFDKFTERQTATPPRVAIQSANRAAFSGEHCNRSDIEHPIKNERKTRRTSRRCIDSTKNSTFDKTKYCQKPRENREKLIDPPHPADGGFHTMRRPRRIRCRRSTGVDARRKIDYNDASTTTDHGVHDAAALLRAA